MAVGFLNSHGQTRAATEGFISHERCGTACSRLQFCASTRATRAHSPRAYTPACGRVRVCARMRTPCALAKSPVETSPQWAETPRSRPESCSTGIASQGAAGRPASGQPPARRQSPSRLARRVAEPAAAAAGTAGASCRRAASGPAIRGRPAGKRRPCRRTSACAPLPPPPPRRAQPG
jgi:hypothetical protein